MTDGFNVPRQLTDTGGEVTLSVRYNPWGKPIETNGIGNFDASYIGTLIDATTGLIYIGNGQYYDPETGRFLTRGVFPNNTNPYVPWNPTGMLLGPLGLVSLFSSQKKGKSKGRNRAVLIAILVLAMANLACCHVSPPDPTPGPDTTGGGTGTPPPTTTPPPTGTGQPPVNPPGGPPCEGDDCTPTPGSKTAYLTFDDGPDAVYTPQIATYLQNHNVHATFFVIGEDVDSQGNVLYDRIRSNKGVLQALKSNGNAIGIHGLVHGDSADGLHNSYFWNHQYFDPSTIDTEVATLNEVGVAPDHLMRAPGGAFSPTAFSGYENWFYYGWNVDSRDGGSGGSGQTAEQITSNVVDGLKNSPDGPIILLHSTNPNTALAITK